MGWFFKQNLFEYVLKGATQSSIIITLYYNHNDKGLLCLQIADFGLSNLYGRDEYLQTFCGSPLYASPEIVNGRPYRGPEVDSWSLGVLLYTLVHGAMPFDGHDYKSLVRQISTGNYRRPTKPSGQHEAPQQDHEIAQLFSAPTLEHNTLQPISVKHLLTFFHLIYSICRYGGQKIGFWHQKSDSKQNIKK